MRVEPVSDSPPVCVCVCVCVCVNECQSKQQNVPPAAALHPSVSLLCLNVWRFINMWVHMPAKPSPYSLDAAPSRQPRPKPFRVEVQLYFVDPSLATDRGGDDDTVVHTVNVAVIAAPPSSLLPPSLPVVAMEHYKETTCRSVAGVVVVVVGDNGRSHEEGGTERGKEGRGVALPAAPPLSLCARALIFSARSKTATRKWPPPRQIVEWTNRTTCADRPTNPPTD